MKKHLFLGVGCIAVALATSSQIKAADTLTLVMNPLEDVEVIAGRIQQTTLSHQKITDSVLNRENTGQNLPYLLRTVPSFQITSDDGLGIGYTYFRVRGTDHTRINMTVNDVPLNDAESQTVFWVNMTDMASSLSSIDVQRGVGTSTNGSASFGASLNMYTGDVDSVSHFTLGFNGGMYKSFREMASAHIVLPSRWQANARFSKVNSDGYLYRAFSDLYSYYGDLGWYGDKTQVVVRLFGGKERTGMGWDGVNYKTAYGIDGADRRYNPAGEYTDAEGNTAYYDNQTDNYAQQHAQLQITHRFTPQWSLNTTLHYTHGGGYYEQYETKKFNYWRLPNYVDTTGNKVKESDGVYRKNLDNHFAGVVVSAKYVSAAVDAQLGVAANDYIGTHFGNLLYLRDSNYPTEIPVNHEYYRASSNKLDANVYTKANWHVINKTHEKLSLYADLQYRYIRYQMDGDNNEAFKKKFDEPNMLTLPLLKNYHFFNPKAGLTYQNKGHVLYGSFAIANREPSRSNFTENLLYDKNTSEYSGRMPASERLYDYELGYQFSHRIFAIGVNLYFMDYDNQLVLTGKVNDVGAQLTDNVKDSYRMGIELIAGVQIQPWMRWDGNIALSRNKILNYQDVMTVYDPETWAESYKEVNLKETTIAFSPSVTASSLFTFDIVGFTATIQTGVTGKQYLDNLQNKTAMLKTYTTTNVNLQYTLPMTKWFKRSNVPGIRLLCQMNNIFDAKYASNGGSDGSYYTDGTACWPWFYAQAGINVHAGFVVNF